MAQTESEQTSVEPVTRAQCICESYARATERSALASARWLGRADQEAAEEAAFTGMSEALALLPIDGRIVIGAEEEGAPRAWRDRRRRRAGGRPRARPARGTRRRRARRQRRDVDDRRRRAGLAADAARHVHAQDGRRPARPRHDRPAPPGRREHRGDRRGLRRRVNDVTTIVLDRPAPPRPDRGDPRRRRAHQADPGRRRDGVDLGRDPRHERPPRDRDRRHAPGRALGGGAALPRRRAPGAALADLAPRDRRRRASTGSRTSSASSRSTTCAPARRSSPATGVSNGDLLRGVRFLADSARTHSLVMCTRCNWVRFVDGIHFFARERREEVRLLGGS